MSGCIKNPLPRMQAIESDCRVPRLRPDDGYFRQARIGPVVNTSPALALLEILLDSGDRVLYSPTDIGSGFIDLIF
jgi:hypothetical protein